MTLEYSFPGVRKRDKKTGRMVDWKYMLTGRTAELYLDQFIAAWDRINPGQARPKSPLVDLYEDHGKVVWDEEKFLHRRYMARWMPKGETRRPMASAEDMLVMGKEARLERDNARNGEAFWNWIDQREAEIAEAESVEERQRRQEQFEWDYQSEIQRFSDFKFGKPEYVKRNDQRRLHRARSGASGEPTGGPLGGSQSKLDGTPLSLSPTSGGGGVSSSPNRAVAATQPDPDKGVPAREALVRVEPLRGSI